MNFKLDIDQTTSCLGTVVQSSKAPLSTDLVPAPGLPPPVSAQWPARIKYETSDPASMAEYGTAHCLAAQHEKHGYKGTKFLKICEKIQARDDKRC